MDELRDLLTPTNCALVLVDQQAGLAFAVQSSDRQVLLNNAVALVRAVRAFDVPVIVSTSASKVYGGPLMPPLREVLHDVDVLERHNMNVWEDDGVRDAIVATGRKKLIFAGLLTEACVTFPVLSTLAAGYEVLVVADACGGLTTTSHELALDRMQQRGARMTSWLQVLLELQRDWTRKETYAAVRAIVEDNGGGYGLGLRYAAEMLPKPTPKP
jgi:nicotinamidase-related amidase